MCVCVHVSKRVSLVIVDQTQSLNPISLGEATSGLHRPMMDLVKHKYIGLAQFFVRPAYFFVQKSVQKNERAIHISGENSNSTMKQSELRPQ